MENKERFLNIPIPMLKGLYENSTKFFNDVFDVGIYLYSITLEGAEVERYEGALKFLGITKANISTAIKNAKSIISNLPDKYPVAGIDKDMLFNYYKNAKSEFELICLAAFLGIKSIIGKKPFDKTNKAMIHARMFGYVIPNDLPEDLTPLQKKYLLRWHMDKVITELQLNWNLKVFWNHNRGIYISFELPLEKLAAVIDKKGRKAKIQELKEQKKRIRENLKNNSNLSKDEPTN